MTKTSDEKSSKIKPYQMILLSCLLAAFMIINSNNVNYNRDLAKLNKEKGELFDRIIKTRRLSSTSSQIYSAEICERGSDDLKKYYQTGDPKIIDIDPNESIKCEDKDETYMKALINIVRTMADDTEEDPDGGRRNLRNLGGVSDIDQQDLTDYGMRFLPMAVFLVFGILSIFGWIFCCICCCCNCCCCCCLKKTSCKVPCFIFTYVFYGLVVGISLYGLIQSNKIFVSLSDTECSILKFFEQVLNGEIKQSLPRWAGIERIKDILNGVKGSIENLSGESISNLNKKMDTISSNPDEAGLIPTRKAFLEHMEKVGEKFYDNTNHKYLSPYAYPSTDYIYDMVYQFGYKDSQGYKKPSYLYSWNQEFYAIDDAAFGYLTNARSDFNNIFGSDGNGDISQITKSLDDGIKNIGDLTSPFTDANDEIGKIFSNFSESIDSYGKMSVKIIFGGLMAMNVALAALMLLICMFSGKSCTSCCCCRCLFKFCTHILWNVLALLMILSFIFGSLIAFVGRFGGDAMSLVSYIMSKENFNGGNPLIVKKLGSAKDYIYTCLHEDGDIGKKLNLGTSFDSLTRINDLEKKITNIQKNFTKATEHHITYNLIISKLSKQKEYEEDITFYNLNGQPISYNKTLEEINEILKDKGSKDKWSNFSVNTEGCQTPSSTVEHYYHPEHCKPKAIDEYYSHNDVYPNYGTNADLLAGMDKIIEYASKEEPSTIFTSNNEFKRIINELDGKYTIYLGKYVTILQLFSNTIHTFTNVIRPIIGDGEAFSFLNGKFIGINLQIILKYLGNSLGGDFFTVGICLCVVGLSLILSISSTIILIVIINIGLKEAIEQNKMINNPGIAVSQFEGVPNMPKPPY